MILEREATTAELLLKKLAQQPLLFFAVWKTALRREIQWNWMFWKARHACWFFCLGCIHYGNMNQVLYLLFHYVRQGTASLEDCYFVSHVRKKHRCILSKCWLNSTFLHISKLNSVTLLINSFSMFYDVFNDLKQTETMIPFFVLIF